MLVKLAFMGGLYRPPEARELEDGHLEIDINTFDALVDLLRRNQQRREGVVELRTLRSGDTHELCLTVYGSGDVYAPDREAAGIASGEALEPDEELSAQALRNPWEDDTR